MQFPQKWVGILRKCVVGPFIAACGNLNWEKYLNLFQNDISSAIKYCIVLETYKTVLHLTNFYNFDISYISSFLKVNAVPGQSTGSSLPIYRLLGNMLFRAKRTFKAVQI